MVIQVAVSTLARYRWIDWVDPSMCPRSVQIIPGLLRARNRHEASIQELTNQVSKCDNRDFWRSLEFRERITFDSSFHFGVFDWYF
ncbi:hypothetical protein Tco_1050112, partial [Tanacetum coccineum]